MKRRKGNKQPVQPIPDLAQLTPEEAFRIAGLKRMAHAVTKQRGILNVHHPSSGIAVMAVGGPADGRTIGVEMRHLRHRVADPVLWRYDARRINGDIARATAAYLPYAIEGSAGKFTVIAVLRGMAFIDAMALLFARYRPPPRPERFDDPNTFVEVGPDSVAFLNQVQQATAVAMAVDRGDGDPSHTGWITNRSPKWLRRPKEER